MRRSHVRFSCLALLVAGLVVPRAAESAPISFSAGGPTAADIQTTVDNFRAALGNPNNGNNAGPLASGRREINWDGGGAATTPSGTPLNAFQNIRGALMSTPGPGTGFVQAPPSGLNTTFSNTTYDTTFTPFSAQRLFSPIGSNITDVTFFVPGSNGASPAAVSGFGAVFSDVDLASTTKLDFFGLNNLLLFSQFVTNVPGTTAPVNNSFSFLGVRFNAGELIGRVRITTGNAAPGPNETSQTDIVMMDDFVFAEPTAVPEPTTIALVGVGLLGAYRARKRARNGA